MNEPPSAAPLFFVHIKLTDAPSWSVAGGVRREGDAGEEQGHVQRRHPQPAEGEQVGMNERLDDWSSVRSDELTHSAAGNKISTFN